MSQDLTLLAHAASSVQASVAQASSAVQATTAKVGASATDILQGYLLKALDYTGNMVDKAVDFVMAQAPLLVQEVLHWYFAYYLILFLIGLFTMLGIIGIWWQQISWGVKQRKLPESEQSVWYKVTNRYDFDAHDGRKILNGLLIIPFIIVPLCTMNLQWLQIYIAPRLWLIEYTAHLIHK